MGMLNKPADYMMVSLSSSMVAMGGDLDTPTAWCTFSYLGPIFDDPTDESAILQMNEAISKCVKQQLEIHFKTAKYYLVIKEEERIGWGHAGGIPFYKKKKNN